MRATNMKKAIVKTQMLLAALVAVTMLFTVSAQAAAPGITGTGTAGTFNLTAQPAYLNQPDGQAIYSWGYGCVSQPSAGSFVPAMSRAGFCNTMQVPGPTLVVTEGQPITVNLTNNLPPSAGNTSILFPGMNVSSSCPASTAAGAPQQGLLTCEAVPGGSVTYTFTPATPGTRAYYSGTQSDLQVEMGMYGAIIVLPASVPAACTSGVHADNLLAEAHTGEQDYRLPNLTGQVGAAYDHPDSCYDREYLFQFSEIDPRVHTQAEAQVKLAGNCTPGNAACTLFVPTEPYHPAYFLINGRSMPDDMDPNYATEYPHQPYNGDPHMHPGELSLIRVVGQGRWQHPFHEHGNHLRILGRDGNLITTPASQTVSYKITGGPTVSAPGLAGPLLFTTTTTPGLAMDAIYYWTGRGLNWDPYGHNPGSKDPLATLPCYPDANGYNTGYDSTGQLAHPEVRTAVNYYEWCQDHNKPVEVAPFGDVAGGGPTTLPDANLFTNGPWYGGSPYLGPNATERATGCLGSYGPNGANSTQTNSPNCGGSGSTPPSGTIANSPSSEAGFAFMWHSHNEREITTNNIFPGGMLMMMLVDSREYPIDETN
jgi:FtsP/CotA-like multicopper oxidase with cupredoxin domain